MTDAPPKEAGARASSTSIVDEQNTELEGERASLLVAADNAPGVGALTGTHAAIAAPPQQIPTLRMPVPVDLAPLRGGERPVASQVAPSDRLEELGGLIEARIATLEAAKDGSALARARLELALVWLRRGDADKAIAAAEGALDAEPLAAAHALLRRLRWGRPAKRELVDHVEAEIAAAGEGEGRVYLRVESARLLEATKAPSAEIRRAWELAFAADPTYPAAQRGLEGALVGDKRAHAEHLEAWSAHVAEPKLRAWLLTERARLLDDLRERDAAGHAISRALALESGIGPVRDAAVRHAALTEDFASLAKLLEEEARLESDKARAARLELEAATIALRRLNDVERATALLARAFQRAPTEDRVDRRVFDELVRIHEAAGRWPEALKVRRARMRFVAESHAEAHELRALAACAERAEDIEGAILALERALVLEPEDEGTLEALDRLLATSGKKDQRVVLWVREAARAEAPQRRVQACLRAAEASSDLGRAADALRNLRAAFVIAPERFDVLDSLLTQLSREPSELAAAEAKSRILVYQQAAERTSDPARRVHYLEKVALLWDELVGDASLAARAYEDVLAADPERRSAVVGLASAAARAGDGPRLARALEIEAAVTIDGETKAALLRRAARAVSGADPDRALRILAEVQALVPDDDEARALVQRIHEEAGRWDVVVKVLDERAERAQDPRAKLSRLLELVRTHATRRNDLAAALATAWRARKLDPSHPAPVDEVVSLLERGSDRDALRRALEELAETAQNGDERARWWIRAAELAEHVARDDRAAEKLYGRALEAAPGDDALLERLARLAARTGQPEMRGGALSRAIDRLHRGDLATASELAERAVSDDPSSVPALRTLESVARALDNAFLLANALSRQVDVLADPAAKLGASWALATLVEWRLPPSEGYEAYEKILSISPGDRCALEAIVRRASASSEPAARSATASALRGLLGLLVDRPSRMLANLELAWLLEAEEASAREALEAAAGALEIDDVSVSASTTTARLAAKLHDRPTGIASAAALARLATDPKARARYLHEEAELLLASGERDRAAKELERALDSDCDNVAVATRLAQLLVEEGRVDRLMGALRSALGRTTNPDAIVPIGAEVARLARDRLADLPIAIDAMNRVRRIAPAHVPSLLTLAELCIAQRTWAEAVDALEAVLLHAKDDGSKLTAAFALASVYDRVLGKPAEAERALRGVLDVDPANVRALAALVELARPKLAPDDLLALLKRLASAEKEPGRRRAVLLEIAELHMAADRPREGEDALIEAAALAPRAELLARIAALHKGDPSAFAASLSKLVARGRELGRVDAGWLATLGKIEVETPGRAQDGIAHLKNALEQEPSLHEARFVLAKALVGAGLNEEALKHLLALASTETFPPILLLADSGVALSLLEQAFTAERRAEQATVVRELEAIAGSLDDRGRVGLSTRRLRYDASSVEPLDRATLVTRVLPHEGRHVLLELAAAATGVEAKALRTNLSDAGISPRDRVGPRVHHPLRTIFDRVCRMLALEGLELVVTESVADAGLVIQDTPWLVLPATLTDKSESQQHAVVARLLARAALGVPWIEELPPAHLAAYTIALARQARPDLDVGTLDREVAGLLSDYETRVNKAIGRRQRKQVAELSSACGRMGALTARDAGVVAQAIARAEARVAFLVTGDLQAVVDLLAADDAALAKDARAQDKRALAAVLTHPIAGDTARFALGPEATALRWRLGSVWGAVA